MRIKLNQNVNINLIVLALLLISLLGFGQEKRITGRRIPKTLKQLVKENYPAARHTKFFEENENGNVYIECAFMFQKRKYELKFISDSIVETEISLAFTCIQKDLQELITASLDSIFNSYRILEVQEVNPSSNPLFEINIKTMDGKYYELFYNKVGILVKTTRITLTSIPSLF